MIERNELKVKVIILVLLFTGSLAGSAQIFSERSIANNLERGKWDKAYAQLTKLKRKDSANAVVDYLLAQYYLEPATRDYQVDSANQYLKKATLNFKNATQKLRDRWKRFPLDSLLMQHLRNKVDSIAFARATDQNTVAGYSFFLQEYPLAAQQPRATELLHEVAFLNALRVNTYQAFQDYLDAYPNAARFSEAKQRYEKLLFESKTSDKRLTSYQRFLKEYPASPYRTEAEWRIFERVTAIGTATSFEQFINDHPTSPVTSHARDILFHLLSDDDQRSWVQNHSSDSLMTVMQGQPQYLVPVLHQGESIFLDDEGQTRFSVRSNDIPDSYWCGEIQEDVLVLPDRLVNVQGKTIVHHSAEAIDDLGYGFLLLDAGHCKQVIHKTGFGVGDHCVQDAFVICNRFLALKKDEKWGVWTFSGVQLQSYSWDDIFGHDQVVVLRKQRKYSLVSVKDMAAVADQMPLKLKDSYDSLQLWKDGLIWVQSAIYQGVLDQNLSIHIPFEKHELMQVSHGITSTFDNRVTWFKEGRSKGTFKRLIVQANWIALKTNAWQFMDVDDSIPSRQYDSVYFTGPFVIGQFTDSLHVVNASKAIVKLKRNGSVEFVAGQDSVFFLLVQQDDKKILYDQHLKRVMHVPYDKIQYAGEGLFIVNKKEHKGLINMEGKVILPVEYDAIGTVRDGLVSLLNSMKFGLFDVRQKRLIKPAYLKNPWAYSRELLVVFKQSGYGFVDWNNKSQSDFVFDEVLYWNDTTALVKIGEQFMLYEIKTKKSVFEGIKNYHLIRSQREDQLMVIEQDNGFGVIHNREGVVIPISYSDIVNLGTKEKPFYFTEKHVEEAALFVVIYYDHEGEMIRKEVYEQEDYERIYCSD